MKSLIKMKININNARIWVVVAMMTVISWSCTNEFEEINVDPNSYTDVEPELLFTGTLKRTADFFGGEMNAWMFMQYGRYASGLGGNGMHQFGSFPSFVHNYWQGAYIECAAPVHAIIDRFSDDPAYNNRVQMARIWKSYIYSVVVSTWGPVPYLQAVSEKQNNVEFDSEQVIYEDILSELADATSLMDTSGDYYSNNADILFNNAGSDQVNSWIRFGNSLRLKIALRVNGQMGGIATSHIQDIVNNSVPLITDKSHDVVFQWQSSQPANYNPVYTWTDINAAPGTLPKFNDDLLLFLHSYQDLRLFDLATPSAARYTITDQLVDGGGTSQSVKYSIPYLGSPIATQTGSGAPNELGSWNLAGTNPYAGVTLDNYSELSPTFVGIEGIHPIITAGETYFMLAEAAVLGIGSDAQGKYEEGIRASYDRFGHSIDQANAYMAISGIAWGTSTDAGDIKNNWASTISNEISGSTANELALNQIYLQRWIAMFYQGHDAWCLQRRTRTLPWSPYINGGGQYVSTPERMTYSGTDYQLNSTEYDKAIATLDGGDNLLTILEMSTPSGEIVDLEGAYSSEFYSEFFGPNISDLEAIGMVDVTGQDDADALVASGQGYIIL